MTISDPARTSMPTSTLASTLVLTIAAGLAACGQKGPLKLPAQPAAAASVGTTVPGSSTVAPNDARDPFSNPPPTALPASVPRP